MQFTDIFIRRPVLATVVSLLILVLGLRAMSLLPIRQYPYTENAVITVTTTYTGADPSIIAGFITTPLENSIAQADGIDYLTSSSSQGASTIQANLRLNYSPNEALTAISAQVNAVLNVLPPGTQQPVITVAVGETIDSMYIGFYSTELDGMQITDYLTRVVQPKLQSVVGVQVAEILGARPFALRAWLEPVKLAAHQLTASDVASALADNDFISAVGRTDGDMITVNLTTNTDISTVEEFRQLALKANNGAIVRLGDVANVSLGSNNYNSAVSFNGKEAVYIGIKVAPAANLLTVIQNVRDVFPGIQQQLPEGLMGEVVYDATAYVNSSIDEVEHSLIEALVIVTIVIFLFLGSVRSVLIPVIAMPLSLIGAFLIMLMFGYSINLLTLLALVLAIGLVVDDAIIVVENVHRHLEDGMTPFDASIRAARELASPIIAISIVLIAVYVPIGFMGGLTGALFTEFAFTLAGAVGVSAIIALTLSPMMCAKFLKPTIHGQKGHGFAHFIDYQFHKIELGYHRMLHNSLNYLSVTAVFAAIILSSIYFLYASAKSELAPQEDQGIIITALSAEPNAALPQTHLYTNQVYDIFKSYPETENVFQLEGVSGLNTANSGMVLKTWDQRTRTTSDVQPMIQAQLADIAGAKVAAFQPASLPGGGSGLPIQFVITTTDDYDKLNIVAHDLLNTVRASGMFAYTYIDLKIDIAQTLVEFDRDKIAQMGLSMKDVGSALGWALGGGYVNYFNMYGRSYQVIPQMIQDERINEEQLLNYYFKTPNGSAVPFSTIATLKTNVVPESINHFQQLNSATISAVPTPGFSLGQTLDYLSQTAKDSLPEGYGVDYGSQSRQYQQEGSSLIITFVFALIIFLCLAAQFESFRDPLIVLISVPMSICGAMIFVSLGVGGSSLNIYTEVGLVTLIGLISKHGILIVQFANDLQREGLSKREAIEKGAAIRLRPILMTTAAMVLGVIPLILATGAGAVSRFNIGLVIATGISIGTLFTLFVVPAMYMFLADVIKPEEHPVDEGV